MAVNYHLFLQLLLLWTTLTIYTNAESVNASHRSDVVLNCDAPSGTDMNDLVFEWTRSDLEHDYVFLYRDGRPYLRRQNPLFRNRVALMDPSFKDGNLGIKLRDVILSDTGRYECHVVSQSHVKKRSMYNTQPFRTIDLTVLRPEPVTIPVYPGQDVVLKMEPVQFPVTYGEWKRADDPNRFVFVHGTSSNLCKDMQNSLYDGRVQLKNPDQSLQDLSIILRNIQPSDNGTYHLHMHVPISHRKREIRHPEPDKVVNLNVLQSSGYRFQAGLGVLAALFISIILRE